MWLQELTKQRGSATMLALLAMLILGVTASTYMVSSGSGLGIGHNYGDAISAQYAAEAGVRYALAHAQENTPDDTRTWNQTTLAKGTITLDNGATFEITAKPLTTKPKDSKGRTFRGDYFKIISVGKIGNTSRSIEAYITVPSNPPSPVTTFDLMANADYSNNKKWAMGKDAKGVECAKAPADEYYQVLFKDTVDANKENLESGEIGFTLDYNVNLVKTTAGHDSDCGYGIYYLATGDSRNMSGYVLQYDPGLTPDQILVKKVVAKEGTTKPWGNEVFGGGTQSFQATITNPDWKEPVTDVNGKTTIALDNVNPLIGQDLMTIPMQQVLAKLNQEKINGTADNKMTGQAHKLTINAKPDGVTGKIVHTISIDGLEILKFIDRGISGTQKKPLTEPIFTKGSTGLRVWQAEAQFYNNDTVGQLDSIKIRSWVTDTAQ